MISQYQYGRLCFEWRGDDLFGDGLLAAIAYWEKAYENGSTSNDPEERAAAAMAALELAELNHYAMLDYGELFKPDPGKAAVWYERSARLRNADAADALSDAIYRENRDVFDWDAGEQHSEVLDKLFEYTKKAADQGYIKAQNSLGTCYANGEGVAKDVYEAVKWYRKAADQGYAEAQFNLGWHYYNGVGVAKDTDEAVKWYRKAAMQGSEEAQKELRSMGVKY